MADHHDIVDSALDLLRSRHWAGPNTNPILENALMQARTPRSRINLRLVLGLGAALIGCGAVAAATRPAWITSLLAQESKAASPTPPAVPVAKPAVVAAAQPPKVEHRAPPAKVPALVAAAPVPSPAPQPAVAAAPALTIEEPVEVINVTGMQLEIAHDPASGMIDAFWDSLLCGDFEACEHLAHMIENPPQVQWVSRAYAALSTPEDGLMLSGIPLIANVLRERTAQPLFITVDGTAVTSGEVTFSVDLQGQWLPGESLDLLEIPVQGGPPGEVSNVLQYFVVPSQPAQPAKP